MEETVTATEALRARVKSRLKRGHLARTATDLSIALPRLEAFANGGELPEIAIHALVKEFYMNTCWDPEQDMLIDTSPPATVLCKVMPEPYRSPNQDVQAAQEAYHAALRAARGPEPAPPRPATPEPAKPNPFRRPGFAT